MPKRPLTQREIRQAKAGDSEFVDIENVSKQQIQIQMKPPIQQDGKRLDFYVGEITVPLLKGTKARFPKSRLYWDQVVNLQKTGYIRYKIIAN